jgi:hypothetical protein
VELDEDELLLDELDEDEELELLLLDDTDELEELELELLLLLLLLDECEEDDDEEKELFELTPETWTPETWRSLLFAPPIIGIWLSPSDMGDSSFKS